MITVDGKTLATLDQLTLTLYQERYRTSPRLGSQISVIDCTDIRQRLLRTVGDAYWAKENVKEMMEAEMDYLRSLDLSRQEETAHQNIGELVHDEIFGIERAA